MKYIVDIREVVDSWVVVEADSPSEARRVAVTGPWDDQGEAGQDVQKRWVPRDTRAELDE